MASSSSASISTKEWKYDVFLSFRGGDTRRNFTSHLYSALSRKNIITFIDDKLNRGEEITDGLMKVIEESRIAIIVFSNDYGSSPFCLDEVAKIIECNEVHGQIVVPVFYGVDPSDVENQTGSFETAFTKHENQIHDFEIVHNWNKALSKAAGFSGWDSKVISSDAVLVDKIVKDILKKLNQGSCNNLENLVGIDSRINEIRKLLSLDSLDIRVVGIWGMGGIGKTTIAAAIFNLIDHDFEGRCFLENVKDAYEKYGGYHLVKKLLVQISHEKDLNINTSDILSSSFVKRRINKKVLVVVDDVSSSQQLDFFVKNLAFFGKGSRIIVTSRDRQTFMSIVDNTYEVQGLEYNEAQQLFIQSAFRQGSPMANHQEDLSFSFIRYANGNPLAIKVLGSFLFGKNQREWNSATNQLLRANKDVQNVFKINYEKLHEDEKEIFLHVACFFNGMRNDEVTRILNGSGLDAVIGLSVLIDNSLVTVANDWIQMPDLLQELGKEIVRQESTLEPGNRSRLWDHEDIVQVLKENSGSRAIKAILLDMSKIDEIEINPDAFSRMHNLKFLKFFYGGEKKDGKVKLTGHFEYLPNELRYIYWHGYPLKSLPANFHPKLVELHLPCSQLKQLPIEVTNLETLQKINLSGCKRIRSLPSISGLISLETLDLSGCLKLKTLLEIPRNLISMDLSETAIEELPTSLETLHKLKVLIMVNCTELKSLLSKIWNLKSLECFDLSGCSSLEQIPEILETMDRLKVFRVANCTKLKSFPSNFCKLKYLEELDMSGILNLEQLPKILETMDGLKGFKLGNCSELKSLPSSFCKLKSLEWFDLSSCLNLEQLPEIFETMDRLKEFRMVNCTKLKSLPSSFYKLKSLEQFNLSSCSSLEQFPEILETMDRMKAFEMVNCTKLKCFTSGLCKFKSLEWFDLSGCSNLEQFPEIFETMDSLKEFKMVNCTNLKSLPCSFYKMKSLEQFNLSSCSNLEEFPEILETMDKLKAFEMVNCTKLKSFRSGFCKLKSLEWFDLSCCSSLKHFPEILETMDKLKEFRMVNCTKLKSLPDGFYKLKSLEQFDLSSCSNLKKFPEIVETMERLKEFRMVNCTKLESLPSSFCKLRNLECFDLSGCSNLEQFPEIFETMDKLKEFKMVNCTKLESLPSSFCNLKSLERFNLSGCSNLEQFPEILEPMYRLKAFEMVNCTKLKSIPSSFCELKSLEWFDLSGCSNLELFPEMSETMDSLKEIKMVNCFKLKSLPSSFYKLKFDLAGCSNLVQLPRIFGDH